MELNHRQCPSQNPKEKNFPPNREGNSPPGVSQPGTSLCTKERIKINPATASPASPKCQRRVSSRDGGTPAPSDRRLRVLPVLGVLSGEQPAAARRRARLVHDEVDGGRVPAVQAGRGGAAAAALGARGRSAAGELGTREDRARELRDEGRRLAVLAAVAAAAGGGAQGRGGLALGLRPLAEVQPLLEPAELAGAGADGHGDADGRELLADLVLGAGARGRPGRGRRRDQEGGGPAGGGGDGGRGRGGLGALVGRGGEGRAVVGGRAAGDDAAQGGDAALGAGALDAGRGRRGEAEGAAVGAARVLGELVGDGHPVEQRAGLEDDVVRVLGEARGPGARPVTCKQTLCSGLCRCGRGVGLSVRDELSRGSGGVLTWGFVRGDTACIVLAGLGGGEGAERVFLAS